MILPKTITKAPALFEHFEETHNRMTIEFGQKVREVRLHIGLSLRDLAREAEMATGYLSDLETGAINKVGRLSADKARRIQDVLHRALNHKLRLNGNGAGRKKN